MTLIDIDSEDANLPLPGISSVEEEVYAGYQDYYGNDSTERWYFPDGKQYIEVLPMNEGARAKYEAGTSRDVRFNRRTDDAAIRMDAAADRKVMVTSSVVGWHNVKRNGKGGFEPVPFTIGSPGSTFEQWYGKADPKLINQLVDFIRKVNPWMTDEMTVAMIDEEIVRLTELRAVVAEREAKAKNS